MPIVVKDVSWFETEQVVTVKVPLKGCANKNVDIFSTNNYIKVSFPPYIYELALLHEIDEETSKATISNGQVIFHLPKTHDGIWNELSTSQQADKEFMNKLRHDAVEYKQKREKERTDRLLKEKDQLKKFAVREQIRIDSEGRKRIEDLKKEEEKAAIKDIDEWKTHGLSAEKDVLDISVTNDENIFDTVPQKVEYITEQEPDQQLPKQVLNESKQMTSQTSKQEIITKDKNEVPTPRTGGSIKVEFTKRLLPTPARESKLPEEEAWLQKLADMNKIKEGLNDAADIEETNPLWLKDKGDDFFKKGNFVAAINAYTSALLLDSKVPMAYSNRAACHLSLKQYSECIQDCTSAIEFYDPPVPSNAKSRCRAYTRRGTAFYHVENYLSALRDYETAIKLDPKNDALKMDAYKIRRIIQGKESSD